MTTIQKFFQFVFCAFTIYVWGMVVFISDDVKNHGINIELNRQEINSAKICGRFPNEREIFVDNLIWQVLQTPRGFVKILNAYLDTRFNRSLVRVNVNSYELNITSDPIYCQFWFDDGSGPFVVKANEFILMWFKSLASRIPPQDKRPYLITCPIEFDGVLPSSVSLTSKPCEHAENNLKIIDNQPLNGTKKRFGVCTKQTILENREYTPRFVEWVELLSILGTSKIHIVVKFVHPDMKKVLDFYEQKGILEVISFLEPSGVSTSRMHSYQDILLQMNMLNECFYRVRNLYDFIVIIDPDEIIMPVNSDDKTWEEMLKHVNLTEKRCSYPSQNLYYPNTDAKLFPEIPKYNYMLQHVQRSVNFSPISHSVKSFFLPEKIIVVHNHNALFSWYDYLKPSWIGWIPTNVSQMSHYRDSVGDNYKKTVEDASIWKYAVELIDAVNRTLVAVGYEDKI